mmetsp:Transcript_109968/g.310853  ORF Transcript_109968/g.310853 Transcript_109968/m.310853 type:complete len:106 (-) Transcript_109968:1012-1329(-)
MAGRKLPCSRLPFKIYPRRPRLSLLQFHVYPRAGNSAARTRRVPEHAKPADMASTAVAVPQRKPAERLGQWLTVVGPARKDAVAAAWADWLLPVPAESEDTGASA